MCNINLCMSSGADGLRPQQLGTTPTPGLLCTLSAAREMGHKSADVPIYIYGPPGIAQYIRCGRQLLCMWLCNVSAGQATWYLFYVGGCMDTRTSQ